VIKTEIFRLDVRGLKCPDPVIQTKKVFDMGTIDRLQVLVDNDVSKENVCRFARNHGAEVQAPRIEGSDWIIDIFIKDRAASYKEKEDLIPCPITIPEMMSVKNVVYIGSDQLGRGNDDLGLKLMRGFLRTLIDVNPYPWRIIFINSGVKLTTVDQEAVDALAILEERGVEILSCGTCLEVFGLSDQLNAGRVTNMYEVIESLNTATKVVSTS
jgi:selenium metabolism protein YedF